MNDVFMCYVEGSKGTRRIHPSRDSAEREAERLSKLSHNVSKKVHVLEDSSCYLSRIETTEYKIGGEVK